MRQYCCGDLVPGCERTFRGTDADIIRALQVHARGGHGLDGVPPETVARVRARMQEA